MPAMMKNLWPRVRAFRQRGLHRLTQLRQRRSGRVVLCLLLFLVQSVAL